MNAKCWNKTGTWGILHQTSLQYIQEGRPTNLLYFSSMNIYNLVLRIYLIFIIIFYVHVPCCLVDLFRINIDNATENTIIDLRCIYTTSEISVRASESELGRNQNKWIDVSCLHWSESVSETSESELVATCSEFLGRGRPRSSEVVQCACSKMPVRVVATAGFQNGHGLGWPRIRASDVV